MKRVKTIVAENSLCSVRVSIVLKTNKEWKVGFRTRDDAHYMLAHLADGVMEAIASAPDLHVPMSEQRILR